MTKITISMLISGASTLVLAAVLSGTGAGDAQACAAEPYIGSVCHMASRYCPYGYVQANGQLLAIQNYNAAFALFGTTYGGDGRTNFGVPDLRGRSAVGYNPSTVQTGTSSPYGNVTVITQNTYGAMRGTETSTLIGTNLPPHAHPATFTGTGGGGSGPLTAAGSASLPVTVSVPAQNVSVSGSLMIGNSTASGAPAISNGAVMTKAGGGQGAIYAPSTTNADTNIGPSQTFNGSTTATTINTTAEGTVALPVTGATGITGGNVAVGANPTTNQPFTNLPPQTVLTACVAVLGTWPPQP